tara:strand:- start:264 stop:1139 length:876 start_codon:yes stop_codon:yes gene_type:complete
MARLKQVSFEQICEEAEQYKTDLLMPEGIHLHQVPFNNQYIQMLWREHYVGSKGTIGRQFHYIVYYDGNAVGAISAGSAVFAHKKRDTILNVSKDEKKGGLRNIVNNTMFRMTRPSNEAPLATEVLQMWKERVEIDWTTKFGDVVRCFETLVEPPRWGGIYKLDGWKRIGDTAGLGARRPEGHGTFGKNSTGKRKIIRVPKKIYWIRPIMSYDEARSMSNSVNSYGDDKKVIYDFLQKYKDREFTIFELSNELMIDKARILICINNIMKQEGEIQAVGSKFERSKKLYLIA